MRDSETPGWIVDRMRANLGAAGIPIDGRDVGRILELGLLWTALRFDAVERSLAAVGIPEHLEAWINGDPPAADAEAAPPVAPRDETLEPPAGSIAALSKRIRAGEVSPVELTERALERIAARDPALNAFQIVLADPARTAARDAAREIAAGRWRGPLHGVPIAVKDLLDMARTPTTAGSRILGDRVPAADGTAVARLRAAGAIIVGKTRLAEFAYSPGSNNAHFGPTGNPHDPTRDTGGSSSGSGAAVAADMVSAAIGTDTGGSIRIPGSLCGIVGLKPTFGRVSVRGVVPLATSLDHIGPMTRTVEDAALVLEAIADPEDTGAGPGFRDGIAAGVRGLRVGVLEDDGVAEPLAVLAAFRPWRDGLATLARAGATLVPAELPVLATMGVVNGALLAMEAAAFHAPMLRARAADYGEFARLRLMAAHAYAPGAYLRARQARADCRRRFDRASAGFDLLSTPTMPGTAPPLGVPAPTRFTAPFNLLGLPAITVPAGTVDGLPIGLQLVGRRRQEGTVLRAARVVEAGG